jgi:outer membrane protein
LPPCAVHPNFHFLTCVNVRPADGGVAVRQGIIEACVRRAGIGVVARRARNRRKGTMKRIVTGIALAIAAFGMNAQAAEGDWVLKVGVHQVSPKSDNGRLAGGALKADVGDDARPTISLEYLFTPNWGLEVLGALPFQHEVRLNGAKAADVKHLPPTVSVQYHFMPGEQFSPFIGVGLNYTRFFSIHEKGPLAGTSLDLSDSWGGAVHAGVDFKLNERWSFTADVRWMNIETDAKVNGAKVGTVKIDPFVYGIAVGYRF